MFLGIEAMPRVIEFYHLVQSEGKYAGSVLDISNKHDAGATVVFVFGGCLPVVAR
jgi:hypothetical protein